MPRERQWQVRAKKVILATGAHERPLVFPDNDRPGIMLADSARGPGCGWKCTARWWAAAGACA